MVHRGRLRLERFAPAENCQMARTTAHDCAAQNRNISDHSVVQVKAFDCLTSRSQYPNQTRYEVHCKHMPIPMRVIILQDGQANKLATENEERKKKGKKK